MEEDIKHICSDVVINHYKNVIISSLKDFDIDILLDKDVEENQHINHMNFGETKMDATLVSCGFNAIIEAITRNICEAYAKKNSVSVVSPYLWRIANINDYGYDVEYSFTLKTI